MSSSPSQTAAATTEEQKHHDTKTVVKHFTPGVAAADVATAFVVAGTCSTVISILDYSVSAKVAGAVPTMGYQVKAGFKQMLTNPKYFFFVDTPKTHYALIYRVCVGVYFSTYATANLTRSWCESRGEAPETVAWKCGLSSSFINTAMTVWKDSIILKSLPKAFTGGAAASNKVPMLSAAGFAFRDTLTCIAAFTITPLLRDYFQDHNPTWSVKECKTYASLITPTGMQLITTLVHIPSIKYQRMYDSSGKTSWSGSEGYLAGMAKQLKIDYIGALRLRTLRIFCAFGLGTLLNSDLRLSLIRKASPNAFTEAS